MTRDAVIVGCGPAGATAAYVLARSGLDVLCIDRARFPRPKLCGGMLTQKTLWLLESLYGLGPERLLAEGVIDCRTHRYELIYRDFPLLSGSVNYPFHFVRREPYDDFWLRQAGRAGATILCGQAAARVDPDSGEVTTADGAVHRGRYVIGADGVHSLVRRCRRDLWPAATWRGGLAVAAEVEVPRSAWPEAPEHWRAYFGLAQCGYGWVFPNRNGVLVGLGGLRQAGGLDNLREAFEGFLRLLGLPPAAAGPLRGHAVPYGNYIARPAAGRVLLTGDAGGYVDPMFGEGLYLAHATGMLAAGAVRSALGGRAAEGESEAAAGPAAAHYTSGIRRYVLPALDRLMRRRNFLFWCLRHVSPSVLRPVIHLGRRPLIHMIHGSSVWDRRPPVG